jgi:hypothetical protein
MKYLKWLSINNLEKIPFNKALSEILDAEDCEFGVGFVGLECLAWKYKLDIPNRKERQMSIINWFIKNIEDLTFDDRDAIEIMQSSRHEAIERERKIRRVRNLELYS